VEKWWEVVNMAKRKRKAKIVVKNKQKNYMIIGLVLLLLVFSGLQAIQVNQLHKIIKEAQINGFVSGSLGNDGISQLAQRAQTMVGGC
jgi:hypothetical protein